MAAKSSPRNNIGIVGAGLGGLALALFLHKAQPNLNLTVLEARPQDATDGGYLALAPNALYILDQLDLYHTLLPQGCAYEDIHFYSARNLSSIGVFANGSYDRFGYPALRIERHIVRQTLLEAVKKAGIDVRYNTKVKSVAEVEGKHIELTLGDNEVQKFDIIVGADGIHSRVRQLISTMEPTFSGQMGIGGGKLDRKLLDSGIIPPCMFMGKSSAFAMMPVTADAQTISCFATVESEPHTRDEWAKIGQDKEYLKKRLVDRHCGPNSEWPEVVQTACRDSKTESLTIWPFFHAPVLESWTTSSSRVILIGDAAHAMPPTGGQGAAQAFEDAASLSKALVNSMSADEAAYREALTSWEAKRQKRCADIKAFTAKGGDMRRASSSVLQQILKEWAIWLYMWWVGRDGGIGWVYAHKEVGPNKS